jgi:hypothetical protein
MIFRCKWPVTVLKMPAFQISLTYSLGGSAIKVLAILDTLFLAVERGKDGSIVASNAGVLQFQVSIPIVSPQKPRSSRTRSHYETMSLNIRIIVN